jgi:aldehyde dehydrogenase (NAD+)
MYGEGNENGLKDQGKMINEFHTKRMRDLLDTCKGEIICGGQTDIQKRFCEPTVILNPDPNSKLMTGEIFGPILPVYTFTGINEPI